MTVATEYLGECEHLNQSDFQTEDGLVIICNDCNSTLNEYEGIWYL